MTQISLWRTFVFAFAFFAVLTLATTPSYAQAISGDVTGVVMDATGAGIPSATVVAESTATGVKTTATTNESGQYRVANLLPGSYTLTVSAKGFSSSTVRNLDVELNRTVTANVTLQVGSTETTVEVNASAVTIDTTTAQVQSTFNTLQATELPMTSVGAPGANFGVYNLSLLSAGVSSSGGVGVGIGPSVGGQRPRNNNFNVEGTDNNRKDVTGPVVYVPNDAVSEFTLLQNQFSPEYGHSSGGQFNLIVKSGTNGFHGAIYEYFQNRNLNAEDTLFKAEGLKSNPRFDQNRLGATFGGPLLKNKLFFFGNYEYNPLGQASTPAAGVFAPTAAGFATLSTIPGLYQTNLDILKKYLPAATAASDTTVVCTIARTSSLCPAANKVSIPIGQLPLASPNFTNEYTWLYSMDYNISTNDQMRGRYVNNRIDSIDNIPNLPIFFGTVPTRQHLFTLAEYHNFTPSLTNEFRFGFNRYNNTLAVATPPYPGLDTFPNIMIDNDLQLQLGPDPNGPQFTVLNTYQIVDNINWTKGKHAIKFGFDGRKLIAPQQFTQRKRGDYNYSDLNQYLRDLAPDDLSERSIDSTPYYGDQIATYFYVNDNWRFRPNLTFNLGLRYEYTTVPFGERLQSLNALSNVPGVITFSSPQPQKKNFAPRIGFAYSPGTSGNTSIRAGFGMAYDVLFDNIGTLSKPPQFSTTIDTDLNSNAPNFLKNGGILPAFSTPTNPADARALTANLIPNQQLPQSISWNLGVQHIFHKDYTIEVRYLGSRGYHLDTQTRINRISAVTSTFNLPTYLTAPSQAQLDALKITRDDIAAVPTNTYLKYGFPNNIVSFPGRGNSSYHGLALQLNRRFSQGLQFVGAYTWSHLIDDSTTDFFATVLSPRRPQDFQDLKSEKASSALDRRHRFTLSGIWDVPFFRHSSNWAAKNLVGNWLYTSSYTYESPEYATVQSGTDSNFNGDSAGDRTIINTAGIANRGSNVSALRNTSGKIVAYLAADPTARYIKAGQGAFANAGRNTLPVNPINNFDMSLTKKFSITEGMRVEFGAQAYNVLNHAQFVPGQLNNINATSQIATRAFLVPGNSIFAQWDKVYSSNPRAMQLVAKFVF